MLFQNPALLWGMLTVAVPIALHFWHQQRAKPMPWAMLRWLETPNQPPQRGLRFDNWLLLLLRCLLLIVLSLLTARPVFDQKNDAAANRRVHLVEPNGAVVQAYRFELQQAQARGERVVWAMLPLTSATTLTDLPTGQTPNPLTWQTTINELAQPESQLHAYLTNGPAWTDAPRLHVPAGFVLHPADAPDREVPRHYMALASGGQLRAGPDQRLTVTAAGSATGKPVATAPLRVLMTIRRADERATLQAALAALTTVYGLTYKTDNQPVSGVHYDWIVTDQPVADPQPGTLYTVTGQPGSTDVPNVRYVPDVLTPQTSELVANGQLPEYLATQLADHLGLSAGSPLLSRVQLAALFVADRPAIEAGIGATHPRNKLQNGLLVLFLSLLLVERYIAIRKGV